MNWSGICLAVGLLGLAFSTMPYGIIILIFMAWVYSRGYLPKKRQDAREAGRFALEDS